MITSNGKKVEIIEDDEPSEVIIDKKTGKKVKKKKIKMNLSKKLFTN